MNAGLLGIYGLYFVMVGYAGNAPLLIGEMKKDLSGYVPAVLAIGALGVLARSDEGRKVVAPFAALALLGYTLSNFDKIKSNTVATLNEFGVTF